MKTCNNCGNNHSCIIVFGESKIKRYFRHFMVCLKCTLSKDRKNFRSIGCFDK